MTTDEYCEECGRTPCCFKDPGYDDYKFKPRVPRFIGVVAFTIGLADKAYGGPEEGGWWYDTFSPEKVFYVPSRRASSLKRRLTALADKWNKNERRYPPSSTLCSGYWTVYQDAITEDEPQERPYYS